MEKIKTTVRIGGRDYTMVGNDSEEHMHRVAVFVDRRMEEVALATHMPTNMVSVLTAMNVADELLKAQDENTRLRKELLYVSQQMSKLRDAAPRRKANAADEAKPGERANT
ncbi:MAG: cell division protein ZapA [Oscillospiraceae bacterium]|jgi:cell division protein ZapA|nr:cell division protein ZapA [Oscillospiraceae bacterium]